ncbi:MAG TPA: FAD-dependent oxidoreductase [Mycobacteriales bacterium]|nr:FAD-dependent oxidoreductase [Mycobacteriales bacterium]
MSTAGTFVIVGAGLAGAKAAETLREEGFAGRIVLIGAESERPYERPPLSKGYLTGSDERGQIFVHDEGWYGEHDVELRLGQAVDRLDPGAHEIAVGGEVIGYEKALIATGSSPRPLEVPGADLDGVLYLREVGESEKLRSVLSGGGKRVVVIGAGWIGLETAAAARGYGNDVTVVELATTPLYAALGEELGEHFAQLHRDQGVQLRTGTGVREITGAGGKVTGVVTDGGDDLPADVVIVGVGIRPNTQLAEAAGLQVDNGIVVDAALRSSDPDVYAAGDVASAFYPSLERHLRVEHWANALNGGPAAARSMLGQDVSYDPVPYFFTDQYELGMEYSGHAEPGKYDQVVYRGDRASGEFIAFWLAGGRVVAGMNVNVWDVTPAVEALIKSGKAVDVARLTDPDVPLEDLV